MHWEYPFVVPPRRREHTVGTVTVTCSCAPLRRSHPQLRLVVSDRRVRACGLLIGNSSAVPGDRIFAKCAVVPGMAHARRTAHPIGSNPLFQKLKRWTNWRILFIRHNLPKYADDFHSHIRESTTRYCVCGWAIFAGNLARLFFSLAMTWSWEGAQDEKRSMKVAAGHPGDGDIVLSEREIEVLTLLCNGLRTGQISYTLNLAPGTVAFHIRNARLKMGARTREQAVARAVSRGIVLLE